MVFKIRGTKGAADEAAESAAANAAIAQAAAAAAAVGRYAAGGPVSCATTANITLSGEQTLDGVLTSASRVLVKAQAAPEENGIYISASGAWSRASDMNEAAEFLGTSVSVTGGTVEAGRTYYCQSEVTTVGTDSVSFGLAQDINGLIETRTTADAATTIARQAKPLVEGEVRQLFDKGKITQGAVLGAGGGTSANGTYFVTGFFETEPGASFTPNLTSGRLCYYREEDAATFVSTTTTVTGGVSQTAPAGARFARLQFLVAELSSVSITSGVGLPAVRPKFGIATNEGADQAALTRAAQVADGLRPADSNVLDPKGVILNRSVAFENGIVTTSSGFGLSGKLPVTPGAYFVPSIGSSHAYYLDRDGEYFAGLGCKATFTASTSGTTMSVSELHGGKISVGDKIQLSPSNWIEVTALGTATGYKGTYILASAPSSDLSSRAMSALWTFDGTIDGRELTVSALANADQKVLIGARIKGGGVATSTQIERQISGTPGGVGKYYLSESNSVGSTTTFSSTAGYMHLATLHQVPDGAHFIEFDRSPMADVQGGTVRPVKASDVANVTQFTATTSGTTMTVSALASGRLKPGMKIWGKGIDGIEIAAYVGGNLGWTGDYTLEVAPASDVGSATSFVAGYDFPATSKSFDGNDGGFLPQSGLNCILLGDSITYTGNYIATMLSGAGLVQEAKHSQPGRAMRQALREGAASGTPPDLTSSDFAATDCVFIALGVNDFLGNRALGTLADASAGYGGAGSFYNDIWDVLNTLIGWKPTLSILMSTPMYHEDATTPASGANAGGNNLVDFVDAIIEVAGMFGVPVVDAFRNSGFNPLTLAAFTSDGLHPNAAGGVRQGRLYAGAWNQVP